jgi:predicted hydrolase (HD superfamily)
MPDLVRYIQKDGQSIDVASVRRRFFETALAAGVGPDKACGVWNDAIFGDRYARQLIEKLCEIQIVATDAGFGFLE